jgi:hypothetical protein
MQWRHGRQVSRELTCTGKGRWSGRRGGGETSCCRRSAHTRSRRVWTVEGGAGMVRRRELGIRYGAFALVQLALCSVEWWWGRGWRLESRPPRTREWREPDPECAPGLRTQPPTKRIPSTGSSKLPPAARCRSTTTTSSSSASQPG